MTPLPLSALDELRQTGDELLDAFRRERQAIAALDARALDELAATKADIVAHMRRVLGQHGATVASCPPEVQRLFATLRIEAEASAMLASTAAAGVRRLLGGEPAGYDRRARQHAAPPRPLLCAAG